MMDHYLPIRVYKKLVHALVHHTYDPGDPENAVRLALGDLACNWPDTIKPGIEIVRTDYWSTMGRAKIKKTKAVRRKKRVR